MANKSTRKLTNEQFQEGTTIDGDRLQEAMDNVADRVNNIPLQDLKKRYVQTQYVGGFSPNQTIAVTAGNAPITTGNRRGYMRPTPFMPSWNKEHTSGWDGKVYNIQRWKGYKTNQRNINESSFLVSMTGNDRQNQGTYWTLEIPMKFKKPVIITDITFYILINTYYQPKGTADTSSDYYGSFFQWIDDFNEWGEGDWANDISVQMLVDSPFLMENREYTDVEVHKYDFDTYTQLTSPPAYYDDISGKPSGITAPANNDMKPGVPNGAQGLAGLCIDIKDKDIPIPANGRVRVGLMIPQYQSSENVTGTGVDDLTDIAPYGRISCNRFHYSWCITALEELEEK
jgi:hypothetical protein